MTEKKKVYYKNYRKDKSMNILTLHNLAAYEYIKELEKEVERLTEIVNDMLMY